MIQTWKNLKWRKTFQGKFPLAHRYYFVCLVGLFLIFKVQARVDVQKLPYFLPWKSNKSTSHRRSSTEDKQRGKCENKLSTSFWCARCLFSDESGHRNTHTQNFVFTVLMLSSSGLSAVRISFSASMSSSLMAWNILDASADVFEFLWGRNFSHVSTVLQADF